MPKVTTPLFSIAPRVFSGSKVIAMVKNLPFTLMIETTGPVQFET